MPDVQSMAVANGNNRYGEPINPAFSVQRGPRAGSVTSRLLALALLITGCSPVQPSQHGSGMSIPGTGTPVTRWSLAADRLSGDTANGRTMAIMHIAMHDALNAAEPRFARWSPVSANEPAPNGASPLVAMAAAAHQVMLARHRDEAAGEADALLRLARAAEPGSPAVEAGMRLGAAIGRATIAHYPEPASAPKPFTVGQAAGQWRPTPPYFQNGPVSDQKPFLFESAHALRGPPPPQLGSPHYVAELEEVRRLGGKQSAGRSPAQVKSAEFWAQQSSQRNFIHLAAAMLQEQSTDVWAQARFMSQLASALADSFIISWDEKSHWAAWRPVTAINLGSEGLPPDPNWKPLLVTPAHPEYPSGHATDCSTGAHMMKAFPGRLPPNVAYTAMDRSAPMTLHFPTFDAVAAECAESRIWAGAHFRAANEEGQRLAAIIARRASASVPPLRH